MKKANVINLIKYHTEKNEASFRDEAYKIAKSFDQDGDYELSEYIMAILGDTKNVFTTQDIKVDHKFIQELNYDKKPLPLPDAIKEEILGVINVINKNMGINKFLFEGKPGTGKTESAKQIANILKRKVYMVDTSSLIDSRLGQTAKNVVELFNYINGPMIDRDRSIILIDEIDAIALDRINNSDHREMGRVTSTFLKCLDELNKDVIIIATTNLYKTLDKALSRRFDFIINFDRYTKEDLIDVYKIMLDTYLDTYNVLEKNTKLFKKVLEYSLELPNPGEMENIIKSSIAFSNSSKSYDYIRRIFNKLYNNEQDINKLKDYGFSVRDIEILTGISKSQVSRLNRAGGDE